MSRHRFSAPIFRIANLRRRVIVAQHFQRLNFRRLIMNVQFVRHRARQRNVIRPLKISACFVETNSFQLRLQRQVVLREFSCAAFGNIHCNSKDRSNMEGEQARLHVKDARFRRTRRQ